MASVKRGTACSWGVGIGTTTDYGRVNSWRRTKQASKTEIPDQDGEIVTVVYHGGNSTAEAEIIPDSTTYTVPAVGDFVVVTDSIGDGESAYWKVDNVGDTQAAGDYVKISLSLSLHSSITS